MNVDIVGEDPVTQKVTERIIADYRPDIVIVNRFPARGGQIKKLAPIYNKVGSPIIALTDLDEYDCPPALIANWFEEPLSKDFLFRVAYGEAESWLMADRSGFAKWLEIDENIIPKPKQINKKNEEDVEIVFKYKPSLYLMRELATKSKNKQIKEMLMPREGAKKGPAYNPALLPFIESKWDIESAMKNSYSLQKAVHRITEFNL